MKEDIKKRIELWLEDLGYSFNNKLYGQVAKMSYYRPSYKIMADTVLKSIKDHNPTMNSNEVWRYTTKFVNGMKSNLIINNSYFQSVFKNGLFHPSTNNQDDKINLFATEHNGNNEYNFLKNIWISSDKDKRKFDFIIIINGFPLVLIEVIDRNNLSSLEKSFSSLEEAFDKFPMFFNFNKLILLTDGVTYKLCTLYDFPEDYIGFRNQIEDSVGRAKYTINQLEKILSNKNILKFLKTNKNSKQIHDYIENSLMKEAEITLKKAIKSDEPVIDKILDETNNIDQKDSGQETKHLDENEELSFLANFFNPDLNKVLDSESFKKRLKQTREVPDFKENKSYIEDFQENRNMNTLETFIKANERLVLKEVNRFISYQTPSMDFDDLYQLGYIGLLKALERFDLERENEFSTYAIYWIRQSITRGINDDSLLVRIPVHRWDSLSKLRKLEYRSEIKFNRVDYDWISKELDLSKEKIMELVIIRNTFMNSTSLDIPVGIDEDTSLGEFIADEDSSVEEIILNMDLRNKLEEILDTLDDRSKDVLIKRFGLNGQEPMTLEEVGDIYDVTRERIRQIESKALRKLRHPSRTKEYKDYCEG
ncbi:sigma-70 family RNA polymerase sigma factor [Clostridium tetani]|uniref:sigma-70 family RNA polymerase sigma factor n=1 Tax=Clostridium tetani TaxID=1513 RepID=UPI0003C0D1F6|nr:sigma-70 family RNA polymerase sigma factor [Clostridium tetani]CDI50598.1 RpoD family RNA polymerase sigma factor [Clostridium tetani 12124569]